VRSFGDRNVKVKDAAVKVTLPLIGVAGAAKFDDRVDSLLPAI